MASTPITFSGFNEIDFNLVLNAVMQQASQPLVAIQSRQTALRSQVTTFDLLANRVLATVSDTVTAPSTGGGEAPSRSAAGRPSRAPAVRSSGTAPRGGRRWRAT